MAIIDLTKLDWTLLGWRPFTWKLSRTVETGSAMPADLGPYPAVVPGSVQQTLLDAGVIEDWNVGVQSRLCEWVEHRHWDFTAKIDAGVVPAGDRIILEADGLDYSGWILIDAKEAARFEGALTPHRFDLTDHLGDGKAHFLSIMFEEPPREQGQIGFTSLSRYFKPRYGYSWDWCPRIVPIGVTGALTIKTGAAAADEILGMRATLAEDLQTGGLEIQISHGASDEPVARYEITVREDEKVICQCWFEAASGLNVLEIDALEVQPWWPNGHGDQNVYNVEIDAVAGDGRVAWSKVVQVGFRRIEWWPCEGASADAEPWICVVNGKPIFLQGANWVPPRALYPDSTLDEYRRLIQLYREMGCTVLRVWGGGILETEAFYDLCDQAGILVWQEFPLSSSGVENWPPDDPIAIERVTGIAAAYIRRRAHHASLLLWCGGNELTGGEDGGKSGGVPIGYGHPCIAALRDVVRLADPGRRFIPTSSSGPQFYAHAENFGKGVHHDVHGPWGMGGFADLEAWRAYWEKDDALFRSEVGMPGAVSVESIRRYAGRERIWPPTGAYWMHTAAWWIQWSQYEKDLAGLEADEAFRTYVERTQRHQADAYWIAADCCKRRFPRCGGFIIWMGHDCFPCPVNNSAIDSDRIPKPAYHALKDVFCS